MPGTLGGLVGQTLLWHCKCRGLESHPTNMPANTLRSRVTPKQLCPMIISNQRNYAILPGTVPHNLPILLYFVFMQLLKHIIYPLIAFCKQLILPEPTLESCLEYCDTISQTRFLTQSNNIPYVDAKNV